MRSRVAECNAALTYSQGDMLTVFEWQLCSYQDRDSHRFADLIEAAIESGNDDCDLSCRFAGEIDVGVSRCSLTGKVKKFKTFKKWAMRVREKPAPKNPLRPVKLKNKILEGAPWAGIDLVAMIRGKVGRSASTPLSPV